MTLVDRHIGQRLVTFPFSPAPPKPQVVVQEVVRKPEALPEAIKEQGQAITKLEREIELLTLLLKRQTEETKAPALYLGRKVSDR